MHNSCGQCYCGVNHIGLTPVFELCYSFVMNVCFQSVEQLVVIQKELQTCVLDIDKTKKLYFDEEHSAHDVRDKEEK